jgi:hypothetical protein
MLLTGHVAWAQHLGQTRTLGLSVVAPAPGAQDHVSVASGPTQTLVVWEDRRGDDADIYAARIRADGVVLDPGGFPVCLEPGAQEEPRVAFDGVRYFAAWADSRDPGNFDVYGAWVTLAGDVAPVAVFTQGGTYLQNGVDLTPGQDGGFLVSWSHESATTGGAVARVYGDGTWRPSISYISSTGDYEVLRLATTPSGFQAYGRRVQSPNGLLRRAVTPDGAPSGLQTLQVDGGSLVDDHEVFGTEAGIVLAWTDERGDVSGDIVVQRQASDGTPVEPEGQLLCGGAGAQESAAVWGRGEDFVVASIDRPTDTIMLSAVSLDAGWAPSCGARSLVRPGARRPDLGVAGSRLVMPWAEPAGGPTDVFFSSGPLALDGPFTAPAPLTFLRAGQRDVAVAATSSLGLIAWADSRSGDWRVYLARMGPADPDQDGTGFPVSEADAGQRRPAVSSSGQDFLVAWMEGTGPGARLRAARIGLEGAVTRVDVRLSGSQRSPAVTHAAGAYRVVYGDTNGLPRFGSVGTAGAFEPDGGAPLQVDAGIDDLTFFAEELAFLDRSADGGRRLGVAFVDWASGTVGPARTLLEDARLSNPRLAPGWASVERAFADGGTRLWVGSTLGSSAPPAVTLDEAVVGGTSALWAEGPNGVAVAAFAVGGGYVLRRVTVDATGQVTALEDLRPLAGPAGLEVAGTALQGAELVAWSERLAIARNWSPQAQAALRFSDDSPYGVGCGCDAGTSLGLAAIATLLAWARRRRSR